MRHLIPIIFWTFSSLIVAQPLLSQNVGQTRTALFQSNLGEELSLDLNCNPRNLDENPTIVTDLVDLNGIYEQIGYGIIGEIQVMGGTVHHFMKDYSSLLFFEIPKSVVLGAVRDGVRLSQTEIRLKITGASTGNSVERIYPQAVVYICSTMAALCGDMEYIVACGSQYVTRDSDVLVQKLKQILIEHETPGTPVVVNPPVSDPTVALPPAPPSAP